MELYAWKNGLETHGIPEDCYSTTEEVVLKVATELNINVNPSDIEITHKLKRSGNNSSAVIVKFIGHKVKTSLYKEGVKSVKECESVGCVSWLFQCSEG